MNWVPWRKSAQISSPPKDHLHHCGDGGLPQFAKPQALRGYAYVREALHLLRLSN